MTGLAWFMVGFGAGAAVVLAAGWQLMIRVAKQLFRTTTPLELARWQVDDRQRRTGTGPQP